MGHIGLVEQLLELSRLESGDLPLHREPMPLRPLVERVVSEVAVARRDEGVAVHNQVPADLSDAGPSDEARMDLALDLAHHNVIEGTGGPFAAIVIEEASGNCVAAGVNLVVASGLSLAHAEAALKHYEQARIPAGARIIARARHLGAYVQADLKTAAERAYAARHRTPEAVLAETAMMDF